MRGIVFIGWRRPRSLVPPEWPPMVALAALYVPLMADPAEWVYPAARVANASHSHSAPATAGLLLVRTGPERLGAGALQSDGWRLRACRARHGVRHGLLVPAPRIAGLRPAVRHDRFRHWSGHGDGGSGGRRDLR